MRPKKKDWIEVAIVYAFLFMLIALSSCRTHKEIFKEDISINNHSKDSIGAIVDDVHSTDVTNITNSVDESENVDITIYDTSKPVNPDTGLPPVLANIHKEKNKHTDNNINNVAETDSTHVEITETNEVDNDSIFNKIESETTVQDSSSINLLSFAFVIAMFAFIVFMFRYVIVKVLRKK